MSSSSFDLAKSLAGAKSLADMVELQTAFWRKQFGALTAQAEEVRELSSKVTEDTTKPIKAQMARGGNGPSAEGRGSTAITRHVATAISAGKIALMT